MTLDRGSRLGPYEITGAIGAGGMGEVFRARDTKLGRDVAIKVLPAAFAQDAERVARFRREAHLLASLNHPNIAAIYGLEEADGVVALALELVEGEDLAERLEARPDPGRRGDRDREADRGGPGGSPREGHRPPRPQARERQGHSGRQGQGPRLRPGQGLDRRRAGRRVGRRPVAVPDPRAHRHRGRHHPRHRGLHVARAGARKGGRPARRHLGLRRAALRDAERPPALRGRDGERHARGGAQDGARLERPAEGHAGRGPAACCGAASSATRSSACATSAKRGSLSATRPHSPRRTPCRPRPGPRPCGLRSCGLRWRSSRPLPRPRAPGPGRVFARRRQRRSPG